MGLRAAVRSRTRLDVRVGVSGAGTRCEAGDDAPASVGVHGLQGRELRSGQPMVFLANVRFLRSSLSPRNPRLRASPCVPARLRSLGHAAARGHNPMGRQQAATPPGRAPLWRRGLWWVAADYISCSPPRSVGPVGRGQAARTASRPLPPEVVQLAAAVAAAAAAAVAAAVDARAAEAAAGACVLLLLVGNAPPVHRALNCLC